MQIIITEKHANRVLAAMENGIHAGPLTSGRMTMQAAQCYAFGEDGEAPSCVSPALHHFKIGNAQWSSTKTRAFALRELALAELGTAAKGFDEVAFARTVSEIAVGKILSKILETVSSINPKQKEGLLVAAQLCKKVPTALSAERARRELLALHQQPDDVFAIAAFAAQSAIASAAALSGKRSPQSAATALAEAAEFAKRWSSSRANADVLLGEYAYHATCALRAQETPGSAFLELCD